MKKERIAFYLFFLVFVSFFISVFNLQKIHGYNWWHSLYEEIENYEVLIRVEKNSDLFIKERIVYNFGDIKRHGIYRYIPLKKPDGKKIRIEDVSVTDDIGNSYKVKVWRSGILYPIYYIRIGDPHKLINGLHAYTINYRVNNALFFKNNLAEIYWNVIGPDWKVPIKSAEARLVLPKEVSPDNLSIDCFTGPVGSKERNCRYYISSSGREIDFYPNSSLHPREAFSIKVNVPNKTIIPPSLLRIISWKIKDNFLLFIPLFSFIFLFIEWYKRGRDPRFSKVIVPRYSPPDKLEPLLMGALWKERITPVMITATIIDLAVKGFILIKEEEKKILKFFSGKDYILVRKGKNEDSLNDYERDILETVFSGKEEIKLSEINRRNINSLGNKLIKEAFSKLILEGYFPDNPVDVKKPWVLIGSILIAVAFVLYGQVPQYSYHLIVAGITGLIFLGFGMIMPRRTRKGGRAYLEILGFKEFIEKAEKYKARFEERENIFEEYLPYAILFGCTKKWMNTFKDIYKNPPGWYVSSAGSISFFEFENAMDSLNTFLSSSVGGAGGGGAGGGAGGGGGGSW